MKKTDFEGEYHSFRLPEIGSLETLEFYKKDGNLTFTHNVCKGYHVLFQNADVLYAEPAWRFGYESFMKRAGNEGGGTFKDYMSGIADIIQQQNKPAFIVCGKHHFSFLDKFNPFYLPVELERIGECYIAIINCREAEDQEFQSRSELFDWLSSRFTNVADFSAGYGATAKLAQARGMNFTCSDVNAKCVYFIAKEFMNY